MTDEQGSPMQDHRPPDAPGGEPDRESPWSAPPQTRWTDSGPTPDPRGVPLLAWPVIIAATIVVVVLASIGARTAPAALETKVADTLFRIQSRYLVGASEMTQDGPLLFQQALPLKTGGVGQRQRFVILAAEMAGVETARQQLAELEEDIAAERERTRDQKEPFELSEEQAEVQRILRKLYGADSNGETDADGSSSGRAMPNVDALSDEERALLEEQLGWTGRLALVPEGVADQDRRAEVIDPARWTFATVIGIFVAGGLVGLAGFGGIIAVIILLAIRRLRTGIPSHAGHHGIYAETFAVWMVVFWGLQIAFGMVFPENLIASFAAVMLSLVALVWPVLRGVPFRRMRADIGLVGGRWGIGELGMAVAGYAMTLPLLAIGIFLTLILLMIQTGFTGEGPPFEPAGGPAHPIITRIADGDIAVILQVLLVGCVAAPIVEEIVFRGVLYRHLRDATRSLGHGASITLATAVNAFLFAVIHPQGWVAIPALMSLAVGFSLMREWRGTLLVPIVMHAISNGIVLGMLTLILSY